MLFNFADEIFKVGLRELTELRLLDVFFNFDKLSFYMRSDKFFFLISFNFLLFSSSLF